MSSDSVPVVVFEEPVPGRRPNQKRKIAAPEPPKEPTIKRLKTEFAKFTAQSCKEKKKYRYSHIVSLGGVPEKEKKIPLPLKRKFEAAKKKRQEKDIALGKLSAVQVKKKSNHRTRKKEMNCQIDTLSYYETLDLISSPLFQDPNQFPVTSTNENPAFITPANPSTMTPSNYYNEDLSCYTDAHLDRLFLERSNKNLDVLASRGDMLTQRNSVAPVTTTASCCIPMVDADIDRELESVACYYPPPPKAQYQRPKSPPQPAAPTPPPVAEIVEQPLVVRRIGAAITKPITVTCNEEEGVLHPDLLCSGSRGKSILYQGQWLTPNQFEYHTGRAQSKYWKRSIYAMGITLVQLIRDGRLTEHDRGCTCGEAERRDLPKHFTPT